MAELGLLLCKIKKVLFNFFTSPFFSSSERGHAPFAAGCGGRLCNKRWSKRGILRNKRGHLRNQRGRLPQQKGTPPQPEGAPPATKGDIPATLHYSIFVQKMSFILEYYSITHYDQEDWAYCRAGPLKLGASVFFYKKESTKY